MSSFGQFFDGASAEIDLPRLIETRLLIQANSGFGKSWAIRRLLEQTAGKVQHLVIDPEGEFASLREKHDYVVAAAKDGDALAHPKTAQLLARRLLETGVSAILDIYDLKAHERHAFVRIFCDALVNAPKALWHPCMVVIDEIHTFCPEAGKAESAGAVIDLATRGRKRGFALVGATQRLAKLHKDTAAELLNKMIGRTGLDIDVKRAADELGMTPKEAMTSLRALDPGEFYAFGPAISSTVRFMQTGPVKTTHPKGGDRLLAAPPKPTAAILKVLPQLADLPKEAEQEAKTLEDLRREVHTLKRELTLAHKAAINSVDPTRLEAEYERGRADGAGAGFQVGLTRAFTEVEALASKMVKELPPVPKAKEQKNTLMKPQERKEVLKPLVKLETLNLGKCERRILEVLSQFEEGCQMGKLTLLARYRKSGGFLNSLASLRSHGLIEGGNTEVMRITAAGMELGPFPDLPDDMIRYWIGHPSFGACERKIIETLAPSEGMMIEELCGETGYAKSGGFLNALANLRTAGVITGKNTGVMKLSEDIRSTTTA